MRKRTKTAGPVHALQAVEIEHRRDRAAIAAGDTLISAVSCRKYLTEEAIALQASHFCGKLCGLPQSEDTTVKAQ